MEIEKEREREIEREGDRISGVVFILSSFDSDTFLYVHVIRRIMASGHTVRMAPCFVFTKLSTFTI